MRIIKVLEEVRISSTLHPRRRIEVLQRDDGCFTFAEQYCYVIQHEGEVIEEGWATLPPTGIYAAAPIAEVEGRAEMSRWCRQDC